MNEEQLQAAPTSGASATSGTATQTDSSSAAAPAPAPLNYFNYFTEIENHFLKRRRSHMFVSPMDWSLMETWKQRGIPLHAVIRGIDRAFDLFDSQPVKYRKVNTLLYCEQSVEECFAEYCASRVGAGTGAAESETSAAQPGDFDKEEILKFQAENLARLDEAPAERYDQLAEAIERTKVRLAEIIEDIRGASVLRPGTLESELTALEKLLFEAAESSLSSEEREQLSDQAKAQLKPYKKKMEKEMYERTRSNFLRKRILETRRIPRLSLFYMS